LTLAILEPIKMPPLAVAIEALATEMQKFLQTAGFIAAFLGAAGQTFHVGGEFADVGHFLTLLKPRTSSFGDTPKLIDIALEAYRDVFVKERHSEDVPESTGMNVYLPPDDASWTYRSKKYNALEALPEWRFVCSFIYGTRAGTITDSFLSSELLQFKSGRPAIIATSNDISISRDLKVSSIANTVGADLRFGVEWAGSYFWLGSSTGQIASNGTVKGLWDWRVLTMRGPTHVCSVFSTKQTGTLQFFVRVIPACGQRRAGSPRDPCAAYRAYGLYSIETGKWSLYRNQTSGIAEIRRSSERLVIVPLLEDGEGKVIDTPNPECKSSIVYQDSSKIVITYEARSFIGNNVLTALKLSVSDIRSRKLSTIGLRKSSSRRRADGAAGQTKGGEPLGPAPFAWPRIDLGVTDSAHRAHTSLLQLVLALAVVGLVL